MNLLFRQTKQCQDIGSWKRKSFFFLLENTLKLLMAKFDEDVCLRIVPI